MGKTIVGEPPRREGEFANVAPAAARGRGRRVAPRVASGRRPATGRGRLRAAREAAVRALWAEEPAQVCPPATPEGGRARWRRAAWYHLLPLALYALIAAVMTYPLVLHLATHVPGDGGDALQMSWDLWWARTALFAGRNPFWTPLLYAPNGAPLYLHSLNLFNGLVSIPVQLTFGLVPAYNTVVFVSFVLAA